MSCIVIGCCLNFGVVKNLKNLISCFLCVLCYWYLDSTCSFIFYVVHSIITGNVSVGNLHKFLPFVLQEIQKQPKRQYLLLHSLKEVCIVLL